MLTDLIAEIPLKLLRRADILDFRERLIDPDREESVGARSANCTMGAIKTALREAFYREERSWGFLVPLNPGINSRVKRLSKQENQLFPRDSTSSDHPYHGGSLFDRQDESEEQNS